MEGAGRSALQPPSTPQLQASPFAASQGSTVITIADHGECSGVLPQGHEIPHSATVAKVCPDNTPAAHQSGRHAVAADGSTTTDEDSVKKSMRRKASMNLDTVGTSPLSKSYLSFSTPVIPNKLNSVGIKLHRNVDAIFVSTNILRYTEFDQIMVIPKHENVVDNTELDEEEANATMDGQLISSLVGIVSEGDLDEAMIGSLYELQASSRKFKSSSNKKPKKRIKVTDTSQTYL
jgi:hypothetical protein